MTGVGYRCDYLYVKYYPGETRVRFGYTRPAFSGRILSIRRLPVLRSAIDDLNVQQVRNIERLKGLHPN